MGNVFLKTVYDKRWFICGWTLGFAFMAFLMAVFYPTFSEDDSIGQLAESLPAALQGMIGDISILKEVPTYLASELFTIRMPMIAFVAAIVLAVGLSVGDEENGQLRTLLSLPVSRTGVVIAKWCASAVILLLISLGMFAGVYAGLAVVGETVEFPLLAGLIGMTWLLILAVVSLIFGIGIATGSRALATSIGVIIAVGSFLLSSFARAVDWLKDYEVVSLLHYFPAVDIAKDGFEISYTFVYIAIIAVSLLVAIIGFRRRDVRA